MLFVFNDEDLSGTDHDPQNQQQNQQPSKNNLFNKSSFHNVSKSNVINDKQKIVRINEHNFSQDNVIGNAISQDLSHKKHNRQRNDQKGRQNDNTDNNGVKYIKDSLIEQFESLPVLHELSNSDYQDQSSIFKNDQQNGKKQNSSIHHSKLTNQSQTQQINRQLFESAQKQQSIYNTNSQKFLSNLVDSPKQQQKKIGQQNPTKIGFTSYSSKSTNEKYRNLNSNIQNTAFNINTNNNQPIRRNIQLNNQYSSKIIDNKNQFQIINSKSQQSKMNNEKKKELQQEQLKQRIQQKKVQTLCERRKQGFQVTKSYQSKLMDGCKQRNGFLFEKYEKVYQQVLLSYYKTDLEKKSIKANGINFVMFQVPNCIKPKPNRDTKKITDDKMYYGVLQSMKDKHFMEMLDFLQGTKMFSVDQINMFQEKKMELLNNSFKYNFSLKPKKKKVGQVSFQNFGQKQNNNDISQSQNNNSVNAGLMSFNDFPSESYSVNGIGWDNTNLSSDQFILNMMNSIKNQQSGNNQNKNTNGNQNDTHHNNQNFINNLYMNMNNVDDNSMNNDQNNDMNKNNNQMKINNNMNKNTNKNNNYNNNFNSKNNNYKQTPMIQEQEQSSESTNFFTQQNQTKRNANKQQNPLDIFKDSNTNQAQIIQNQEEIQGNKYMQKIDKIQLFNLQDQFSHENLNQQQQLFNSHITNEQKGASLSNYLSEGFGRISQFLKIKVFGSKQNFSQQ